MADPQFIKAIDNEVSALAKKYNLPESKAFLIWFGKLAVDVPEIVPVDLGGDPHA